MPDADLVADHDDRARPGGDGREAGGDGSVEDRVDVGDVVAEEARSATASSRRSATGSSGSVRARAAARSVPTSIVGQAAGRSRAVPGDPVVELGVARPGGREEPGATAVRQAGRGREPEAALAAAGPPERQDQRLGHGADRGLTSRPTPTASRDDEDRRNRRARRSRPSRRRRAAARRATIARASDEPDGRPRPAHRSAMAADDAASATAARDRRREHGRGDGRRPDRPAPRTRPPKPPGAIRDRAATTATTGQGAARRRPPRRRRHRRASPRLADASARQRATLRCPRTRINATTPASPDGGILPGPLGADGVGREERVGGVGQAVEVERARSATAISADAPAWLASSGSSGPMSTSGTAPIAPDERPDERERGRARRSRRAAPSVRTGSASAVATPRGPRPTASTRPRRPGHRRTVDHVDVGRDRQPDERRVDAEHRPDVPGIQRRRRRAVGHDPARVHDARHAGRSWPPARGRGGRR